MLCVFNNTQYTIHNIIMKRDGFDRKMIVGVLVQEKNVMLLFLLTDVIQFETVEIVGMKRAY